MKTSGAKSKCSGLTLIELLVVIAIIAILAAMVLPTYSGPRRAYVAICMNNQKQIALGLIMFQGDHAGKYPWQDSVTNGGTMETALNNHVFPNFNALSAYTGKQPRIFVCPKDKAKHEATNYAQLSDDNISYFFNMDAVTNSSSILTGERTLETNGKPINSGVFTYTSSMILKWADGFHLSNKKPWGGFSFADGHVQFIRQADLNSILQKQPLVTNRLCIP